MPGVEIFYTLTPPGAATCAVFTRKKRIKFGIIVNALYYNKLAVVHLTGYNGILYPKYSTFFMRYSAKIQAYLLLL